MSDIDVWGSFGAGVRLGGALRAQREERERTQRYGDAYSQGGWAGVADAAGGEGDMETAGDAQGRANDAEETAHARATRNFTVLGNAATSLLGVPYEQRGARLQQMAPMLEQMGLDPAQIAQFDPTDENLANIRGLQGQFSQYSDIRQQGDAIVGVRPDGSVEVLRQERPTAPQGYQWNEDGSAVGRIPGYEGPAGGSGGVTYAPPTPEQVTQYNLPGNGSGWVIGSNGRPVRVGGGGTFPADQRARVAISFEPALEASQLLDSMEEGGYRPHHDWGAASLDALDLGTGLLDAPARVAGGLDLQSDQRGDYGRYESARRAFESAILPILSGAAVTESEARRLIRAAIPGVGDSDTVLADKSRRRQQMLNGAAVIGGRDLPFPDAGVPEWARRASSAVEETAPDAVGLDSLSDEQLDQLEQELLSRGQ